MQYLYPLLLASVLVLHFLWILFVVTGWIYCSRFRLGRRLHLASVAYSLAIEILYFPCPLTYVENYFRQRLGWGAYSEPFIAHYLSKIIYCAAPRELLIFLAVLLLLVTLLRYRL